MRLIERPGYLGRKRDETHRKWNEQYGAGNWELRWEWGERLLTFPEACRIYEDGYFQDSLARNEKWMELFANAREVFDNAETNINSGLDYTIQEAYSTHLQDIAVRNVGLRRGWRFKGNRLIQIRGPETEGYWLMPGLVKFHIPKMIEQPNLLPDWAMPNSVEAFYQNNKWLAIK